ncbi:MAG: hypothetical protein HY508_00140 [Acidobacteria bacterium]|nr:hypothetical protein [Acidobacteriota bacterium]
MSKKITIRKLAEMAEAFRYYYQKDVMEAEYRKRGHFGKLTRVRFGRNQTDRPTKKIIECLDNGILTHFDKNYELELLALTVNGNRREVR